MFIILGIVSVFGAVIAGFLMEKGNLIVLLQPAELVIIGGAGVGTLLISSSPHVLGKIFKGVLGSFKGAQYTKERYLQSLKLLYELFDQTRKKGLTQIESEIEEPTKGKLFTAYRSIVQDHETLSFICDTFRTIMIGGVESFDLDQMMETDVDVRHHETSQPVTALTSMADSLPGLGIVAAVLGVVVTMGALGGPPEQIGHKVAAALVGTFLGILLCYGLVGPLAARMARETEEARAYFGVLRIALTAFSKGIAPLNATEMARRAIPNHVRPTFKDLETSCRTRPNEETAVAPAA